MGPSCVTVSEDDVLAEQLIVRTLNQMHLAAMSLDGKALQLLEQITKFDGERYEVALLWKRNDPFLPIIITLLP